MTLCGGDWSNGTASDSESMDCKLEPCWDFCFSSLPWASSLPNVHPLHLGKNWYLVKDIFYSVVSGIIAITIMGVFVPQGDEMVVRKQKVYCKGQGVKLSETRVM